MDATLANIARAKVEAYDFQADYRWNSADHGVFEFYWIGTWQPHFERQTLATSPLLDSAGYSGGPLKWRANGGMNWNRGPWRMGWNTQLYDSRFIYSAGSADSTIASAVRLQGHRKVPRQIYHDLFAGYRFADGAGSVQRWWSGAELLVGIRNIFGTLPPVLATAGTAGYSGFGDPRLRSYSISLRAQF